MSRARPPGRSVARGAFFLCAALCGIDAAAVPASAPPSPAAALPASAKVVFPFGDSLWAYPDDQGNPRRLAKLPGASFARAWERAPGGLADGLVAADTRGGRLLALAPGAPPRELARGDWSWAGAGAGRAATASREYRDGFEFRVLALGGPRSPSGLGAAAVGTRLDCFVSDALFLGDSVLVAGANKAGSGFSVWELELAPGAQAVFSLPRKAGFLRLAGDEERGAFCFVSAPSSTANSSLTIWGVPSRSSRSKSGKAEARLIEPRFASPGAIAWFGSGWIDSRGRLAMPLSLAGGGSALSLLDPRTGAELARLALPAPPYQALGTAKGLEYAILYDHAKAPGRFILAVIDPAALKATTRAMP